MLRPKDRPMTAGRERYMLACDAFLVSGALWMALVGALAMSFSEPTTTSELLNQIAILVVLVGGALVAWVMHGHGVRPRSLVGLLLGLIAGAVVCGIGFGLLWGASRFLIDPVLRAVAPDAAEGPWGLVVLVVIAGIAFLAVPVLSAVRDLIARPDRRQVTIAAVRITLLALIMAAIVATVFAGDEAGEVGIFMVPIALASGAGAWGMAFLEDRRRAG